MDLSEERVRVVKSAAVSVLNRKRRNLRVEATTDLRGAVEGADLVIYTIRVGGLEALEARVKASPAQCST
ncbi:MAG: hypothetical protein DRJ63_05570 [Thermoprotei archaeon]|nr:MAG: hypothetical protein DRJ63_05570 [Thermoprotei archaeon]